MLVPKYISRFYRDSVPVSGDFCFSRRLEKIHSSISGCFIPLTLKAIILEKSLGLSWP